MFMCLCYAKRVLNIVAVFNSHVTEAFEVMLGQLKKKIIPRDIVLIKLVSLWPKNKSS